MDDDQGKTAEAPGEPTATVPLRGEAPGEAPPAPHFPLIGRGTYVVGAEVARGGIGRVVRAHDTRLGRTVALKELLPGRGGRGRFAREAFITAGLEHPGIVAIHEAGQWPDGQPFYAMKLVQGRSLADVIAATGGLSDRLALVPRVTAVAQAIAYAHSRRVIHRDLKPHNVILGDFDETVVVDWGLAKDLERPAPEESLPAPDATPSSAPAGATVAGDVLGTPPYMPPEQARGENVDERADVYALGAMLYHLLAGAPPYLASLGGVARSGGAPPAPADERTAAQILEELLQRPPAPLALLAPDAPPDLLTIVGKAMAREAAARYASATEMAADLHRFQTGQLVSARRYTRWALLKRWARRHRAVLAVVAAAVAVLAAGGVVSLRRVLAERQEAESQRAVAVARRAEADAARQQAEMRQAELIVQQARVALERDPTAALAWLKLLPPLVPDWRAARAVALDAASRGIARHVWRGHGEGIWSVAASRDGRWLLSGSADDSARLWDRTTGESIEIREQQDVNVVAFAPASDLLATAGDDGQIRLWETARVARLVRVLAGHGPIVTGVAFSPDGRQLVSSGYDGTLRLWDLATGSARVLWDRRGRIESCAFSPRGDRVAAVGSDGVVRLFDLGGGAPRLVTTGKRLGHALAFSPDGALIATGAFDGSVLVAPATGGAAQIIATLGGSANAVVFSPDGRSVAVGSGDRLVHLLDRVTGASRTLAGHDAQINAVAFTPDGRQLVSGGTDRMLRVWPVVPAEERVLVARESQLGVAFSADGTLLASVGESGDGWLFDLGAPSAAPRELPGAPTPLHAGYLVAGRLLGVGVDASLRAWDLAGGAQQVLAPPVGELSSFPQISDDGAYVAYSWASGARLRVRAVAAPIAADLATSECGATAFGAGGKLLAFSSGSELRVCDPARCAESQRTVLRHGSLVTALGASPRGQLLASAARDRIIWLHDLEAGASRPLGASAATVWRLVFSSDGGLLASAASDGAIEVRDLRTGAVHALVGHNLGAPVLRFSPDGTRLASASYDDTLRLWDLRTGESRLLRGHRDRVNEVVFSPDGRTLASAGRDGTIRLWPIDAPSVPLRDHAELDAWLASMTTAHLDRAGRAASN